MARVRIDADLIYKAVQMGFMLPNEVRDLLLSASRGNFEAITTIEGFAEDEIAVPIYHKSPDGSVSLIEIKKEQLIDV